MKKSLILPALFISLLFTNCTKDQIEPTQDTPDKVEARLAINSVSNSLLNGSWNISYIVSNSTDATSKYKGCSLSFTTNNLVICKSEMNTSVVGKWVVSFVDRKTRVSLSFLSNSGFEAVNGDWTVLDGSNNLKIPMQGIVDQKSYLILEKQ